MAYRNYSTAAGHIVDATGNGDFTTLSAALTAATAGQTIFLRPGTYGSATLKPGVNISSFGAEGAGGSPTNVIIDGNLTLNTAGHVNIYGVTFTSTSNVITNSGSAASIINVGNCYFNISTSTPISFTNTNASSQIVLRNCSGDTSSTSVALFAISGAGTLKIYDTDILNSGLSTADNGCSSGSVIMERGNMNIQFNFTGSGAGFITNSTIDTSAVNLTPVLADSSDVTLFNCILNAGTAEAATVSGGLVMSQCFVDSGNANAISGTGTLFYSDLTFGSSNVISVTNPVPQNWQPYGTAGTSGTAIMGTSGFDSTYFTVTNGFVSKVTPVASAIATSNFGSTLTLGTAIQNTLGYDILVNVNIQSSVATSATIVMGVGPTASPATNAVTGTFSGVDIISFSAIVPNNYYLLVNSTGTFTASSIVLQVCAL